MDRRSFIKTSGASIAAALISQPLFAATGKTASSIGSPDSISAFAGGKAITLSSGNGQVWTGNGIGVALSPKGSNTTIAIQSAAALSQVTLSWKIASKASALILNDHWERTYGDVSWHKPNATEILPWYFLENNGGLTSGFGVKTGASTFCFLDGSRRPTLAHTRHPLGHPGRSAGRAHLARRRNRRHDWPRRRIAVQSRPTFYAYAVRQSAYAQSAGVRY